MANSLRKRKFLKITKNEDIETIMVKKKNEKSLNPTSKKKEKERER